jgi:SAM-dependent methyltransferase
LPRLYRESGAHLTLVFEDRSCPLCGSSANSRLFAEARFDASRLDVMSFSSRKTPEGMHHRLLECTNCDLLYASPVPTVESIGEAYRDAGYSSGEEARYAAATYATLVEKIERTLPDKRGAVDIGAGDGAFLHRLRAAGFDRTVGFEPSNAPRAAAAADVRELIRPEPFVPGVLPDERFTLVSCLQTIEHVLDPLGLCTDAARVLAPAGAMLIVCHDRRALSARVLRHRSPIYDIEHVQLFSARSVGLLLHQAGFERVEVHPLRNRYPLRYWLQLAPLAGRVKAAVRASLEALRLDGRAVSLGAGNMFAIAYKPET